MFKIKRFLSLTLLLIGGLVGLSLPWDFCVAQSFGPLNGNFLYEKVLKFSMPKSSVYLYAVTEPNTYTIKFNAGDGGIGTMEDMFMTFDSGGFLSVNSFTHSDGYIFKGWSISETGIEVDYTDGEWVNNLTYIDSGEVVLYALRGVQVSYTVQYYKENVGGTGYDVVTGTQYGMSNTIGEADELYFTGFTYDSGDARNVMTGIIDENGNTVLVMYYTRNTYNLKVMDREEYLINTGVKFEAPIILPDDPEWEGNTFDGWDNIPDGGIMPAEDVVIKSKWSYGIHTITFDTDGGTEIEPLTGMYGDSIDAPENPTKEGYEFVGWDIEFPIIIYGDDITVKAIWKEIDKDNGGGRSGGGRDRGDESDVDDSDTDSGDTDSSEGEQQHEAAMDKSHPRRGMEDLEVFFAYMWAHDMGIIESSREDSDPDGYVTRGDMAEMVVKFTDKVLGRGIPSIIPAKCTWGDAESERKSPETKVYAQKACALGVMGIRMQDFMPNKILDRAEFGTILSRLLWGDKYDVVDATKTKLYYTRHLKALSDRKIMTQIDNPEEKKELRKWAWLMLMRSRIENIEKK